MPTWCLSKFGLVYHINGRKWSDMVGHDSIRHAPSFLSWTAFWSSGILGITASLGIGTSREEKSGRWKRTSKLRQTVSL